MAATVKLYRKCQVAAKVESAEGTAETLAAANATIKAMNVSMTLSAAQDRREVANADFGEVSSVLGMKSGSVDFDIDLCGSGVNATTAPEYNALLKMVGFSEAIAASVVYSLTSTQGTGSTDCRSGTVGFYVDGSRYLIAGARGTWEIRLVAGQRLVLHITLQGKWVSWGDVTLLSSVSYQSALPIICRSSGFTFNSVALKLASLTIMSGNEPELREDANDATGYSSCAHTGRAITADLDCEVTPTSEIDFIALADAATEVAMQFRVGTAGGNRITVAASKVQVMSYPSPTRRGNRLHHSVKLKCDQPTIGSGGELTITFD